jgi:NADPH2:quinone reductase
VRAVVITNGELSVQQRDDPHPGPGDVLVAVRAAGLNAADLLQQRGFYPPPPGWPVDVPGLELSGEVRVLGNGVSGLMVGQRVCAIVGGGAQATHCVVPAEHLISVPNGVEITSAGGFAEGFITAYDALISQGELHAGERVLISGAAGGVGCSAIQIARAFGAHVTAVTRDERHHVRLRLLGAHDTVTMDQVETLERVDVVLELVGAAHFEKAQKILAPRARVVIIGVASGSRSELDLLSIMSTRARIMGSTLRARSREEKSTIARIIESELVPLWAANKIHVPVTMSFPLEQVRDAYAAFADTGKFGKILLTTN